MCRKAYNLPEPLLGCMDVSEQCMYQMANSCTIALSEAGTAMLEGDNPSKTCLYHVQTCMYNVHTMFKHVHTHTYKRMHMYMQCTYIFNLLSYQVFVANTEMQNSGISLSLLMPGRTRMGAVPVQKMVIFFMQGQTQLK